MNTRESSILLAIYGDSLSMPRSFAGVSCDQVYGELLRKESKQFGDDCHIVVFNRSQGGIRIVDLFECFQRDLSYINEDKNKILIIQCGVVDCAPRPIPFALRKWIGKLPFTVKTKIFKFLHDNRYKIQRVYRFHATSAKRFRRVFKDWLVLAGPVFKKIYVINIFPTTQAIAKHSYGFAESIEVYNRILAEEINRSGLNHAVLIDVFGKVNSSKNPVERFVTAVDGHHLTPEGHELLKALILSDYEK